MRARQCCCTRQRAARAKQRKQRDFQNQRQHQRQRAVTADARIFHDAQGFFARAAAAQSVAGIGQTVFMKTTSQPHTA